MDVLLQLKDAVGERIAGMQKELGVITGYFKGFEED